MRLHVIWLLERRITAACVAGSCCQPPKSRFQLLQWQVESSMASPVLIPQIKLSSQITQFATHIQKILTILFVSYHALYVFVMWFSLLAFIVVWYPICNHHIENLTFLFVSYGLIMCLSNVIFTCSFSRRLMPNLQCEMVNTLKQALFDTILRVSFCTLFVSCMVLGKIVSVGFFCQPESQYTTIWWRDNEWKHE
jgi:hypothetical protein